MRKPRVMLLSDVRGWAFDQNLHDIAEVLEPRFDCDFGYVWEWTVEKKPIPDLKVYDVVFAPYHRWGIDEHFPWDRTLGSLRAQWLFPEKKRAPQREEIDLVNKYRKFHFVNQKSFDEYSPSCPGAFYLTNAVNMKRFPEPTKITDRVVCSWNGNAGHSNMLHEDVKGFHSIVRQATLIVGVPLVYAEYNTCRKAPHEMPAFYQQANLALCASLYEGASSSVMEAMASGQAVIATDCGNHREMHESMMKEYGDSGIFLVERSFDAMADAIWFLKNHPSRVVEMGELNRREITRAWSWDAWASRCLDFFTL